MGVLVGEFGGWTGRREVAGAGGGLYAGDEFVEHGGRWWWGPEGDVEVRARW